MVKKLLAFVFGLLAVAGVALATPDPVTVDLTSNADIATRLASLINLSWGVTTGAIPVNLPAVTTGITNNWPALTGLSRVDQYVFTPTTNANSNTIITSWLYWPTATQNGRVVAISMGHQGYCLPASYATAYGTQNLTQTLLDAGFVVYVTPMPGCNAGGNVSAEMNAHASIWATSGDAGIQYFLDPTIQAVNYWQQHGMFKEYNCVGLSGGGWTCLMLATLDPRFTTSIHVAGSVPNLFTLNCPSDPNVSTDGDARAGFLSIVTTLDQYVMGGYYGGNHARRQIQVYNAGTPPYTTYPGDDCCFGPSQWLPCDQAGEGGRTYLQFTAYFPLLVQAAKPIFPGMNYMMVRDPTATSHQISAWSVRNVIMPALTREISGARRRF